MAAGVAAVLVAGAIVFGFTALSGDDANETATAPTTPSTVLAAEATTTTIPAPTTTLPSIDAVGSDWWLVNPQRPMAPDYVPPDLVTPNVPLKEGTGAHQVTAATGAAFEAMVAEARTAGFELQLNSGYRSFQTQQELYDRFVADYGAEVAAERVAVPGTSEHQTGLAADVGLVGLPDDAVFGDTPASAWVAANSYRFGLIVRYPPAKADITGYTNEPWHLRYVGVDLAAQLFASGLTMEEHFGLVPAASG